MGIELSEMRSHAYTPKPIQFPFPALKGRANTTKPFQG
jgi:hypothetical protein